MGGSLSLVIKMWNRVNAVW